MKRWSLPLLCLAAWRHHCPLPKWFLIYPNKGDIYIYLPHSSLKYPKKSSNDGTWMLRVAPFMVNFSRPPGLPPLSLRPFHHRAAGLCRRHDGPSGWSSYVNHWRCQLEYQGMRWDQDIRHENLWNPIGGANETLIWRYVKIMRIKVAWEMDEKNPPSEMMVKFGRKAIVWETAVMYYYLTCAVTNGSKNLFDKDALLVFKTIWDDKQLWLFMESFLFSSFFWIFCVLGNFAELGSVIWDVPNKLKLRMVPHPSILATVNDSKWDSTRMFRMKSFQTVQLPSFTVTGWWIKVYDNDKIDQMQPDLFYMFLIVCIFSCLHTHKLCILHMV